MAGLLAPINYLDFTPAPVAGVDEVGRGCLAGPVYAAAVCFRDSTSLDSLLPQLTDSKLLSEKRREQLSKLILESHWVGIGSASVDEIDRINILQASLLAMARAVAELERQMGVSVGHLLVDGNQRVKQLSCAQTTVVKGDLRCAPISAASIVAKVTRDHLMQDLSSTYPEYGFAKHKGYASAVHRAAIAQYGPTPVHRKTFGGVKEFLSARP